jgi:hypothetical protein
VTRLRTRARRGPGFPICANCAKRERLLTVSKPAPLARCYWCGSPDGDSPPLAIPPTLSVTALRELGLTVAGIGSLLGVSDGAVRQRLHREAPAAWPTRSPSSA